MSSIKELIHSSVHEILSHPQFAKDVLTAPPSPSVGDIVTINNSFDYRASKGTSTKKSKYYIAVKCEGNGQFHQEPLVATGFEMKKDFKHWPVRQLDELTLEPLDSAIEGQMDNLGQIVFTLISCIEDNLVVDQVVQRAGLDKVVWDPSQSELLCINGRVISVKDAYAEEALWASYMEQARVAHLDISDSMKTTFGECLDVLQRKAMARLRLPDKDMRADGFLDSIVAALRGQYGEYCTAMARCHGDPAVDPGAFNEVLRIAYNFASEATQFLKLIIHICDLKPIVLWGTLGEHYALSEAFRTLPWTRSDQKKTVEDYREAIGDARNSAFHHLFPFQKQLSFLVPPTALQNVELHIFSEHRAKKDNELTYQDKELVEVLLDFTHARQRRVTPTFWLKNEVVFEKTIDLFDATNRVLKSLYAVVG